MKYAALAADYDGTLATQGRVETATLHALERLKSSGCRLILVTGRLLDDLLDAFPQASLCDRIVAENGAVLYDPATRAVRTDGTPVPRLEACEHGRIIAATRYEAAARRAILGLDLRMILNRGAFMILPAGVDKASGLRLALQDLGLSPQETVGVGDGENDQAFLDICGLSVAVPDAVPGLRARLRMTVLELIERILVL